MLSAWQNILCCSLTDLSYLTEFENSQVYSNKHMNLPCKWDNDNYRDLNKEITLSKTYNIKIYGATSNQNVTEWCKWLFMKISTSLKINMILTGSAPHPHLQAHKRPNLNSFCA